MWVLFVLCVLVCLLEFYFFCFVEHLCGFNDCSVILNESMVMLKSVFTYVESKPDFTECTFVIVRSYLSQWNIMTKINNVNLCVCLCVCVVIK